MVFSSTLETQTTKRRVCVCVCVVCWEGALKEWVWSTHSIKSLPGAIQCVLNSVSRILCPGCRLQAQGTGGKSQQGSLLTALPPFPGHLSQPAVARSQGGWGEEVGRVQEPTPEQAQCSAQKNQSLGSKRSHLTPTQLCDLRQVATSSWGSSPLL